MHILIDQAFVLVQAFDEKLSDILDVWIQTPNCLVHFVALLLLSDLPFQVLEEHHVQSVHILRNEVHHNFEWPEFENNCEVSVHAVLALRILVPGYQVLIVKNLF